MFPFTTSRIIASDPNEKKKSSMYPVEFFEYRYSTIKMRSRVYWTSWLIKRFLSDSVWNLIRDSYKFKTFLTQWYYLISMFLCIFKAILNEGSQSIMSFIQEYFNTKFEYNFIVTTSCKSDSRIWWFIFKSTSSSDKTVMPSRMFLRKQIVSAGGSVNLFSAGY